MYAYVKAIHKPEAASGMSVKAPGLGIEPQDVVGSIGAVTRCIHKGDNGWENPLLPLETVPRFKSVDLV